MPKFKRFTLLCVLIILLQTACNLLTPKTPPYQATVEAFQALTAGLEIPEYFMTEDAARRGDEFDVNQFFTVLDHLSLKPGYTLDYVYQYDFMGGFPLIYARRTETPAYRTFQEYQKAGENETDSFLDHVRIDDTPEGFFQFIVLQVMGGQFYLWWHANYNDHTILADSSALDKVFSSSKEFGIQMSAQTRLEASRLDFKPKVGLNQDTVSVKMIVFTKWGGFRREEFTIQRSFPHTILDEKSELLVPYDCGIMF